MKLSIRQLLILALLGLQTIALTAVFLSARANTQRLLLDHAESVIGYIVNGVEESTRVYLGPAQRAALLTSELIQRKVVEADTEKSFENFFFSELKTNSQLKGIYFAQPSGSFYIIQRTDSGFHKKVITVESNKRTVEISDFDKSLKVIARNFDPKDTYDPRLRPWYISSSKSDKAILTDPYIFFTSKKPGITVANAIRDSKNKLVGVVGVDIDVSDLSRYFESIPSSPKGKVVLLTQDNKVVGAPGLEALIELQKSDTLPNVADLKNPSLEQLVDQEVSDKIRLIHDKDFGEYFGKLSQFDIANAKWKIGLYAPTSDFVGVVNENFRRLIWQLFGIALGTGLLAIPLTWGISRPLASLVRQATTDELTDIPNRSEFFKRGKSLLHSKKAVAVAVMDIDNFKQINDQHGHDVGDEVLSITAQRILRTLRKGDVFGRIGGDEFALVIQGSTQSEVDHLIQRLHASVHDTPIHSTRGIHETRLTIGISRISENKSLEDLVREADQALLKGKREGRGGLVVSNS